MRYININGSLLKETEAGVPYDSRAVRFGYGLFETMLIIDGEIKLNTFHFDRLMNGIAQLKLVLPELMDRQWMEQEVMKTVRHNKMEKLCRVRFHVYAGRGGLFDGQSAWTEFIIETHAIETDLLQLNPEGYKLIYAEGLAKSPNDISNLKTSNAMIYALAARQAKAKNVDNALMLNTYGNVIETTLANIFCVKDDIIYTPPLTEGCVAGVMRRYLLQQLPTKGFNISERPFTKEFLQSADAVFTTNAIRRLKWIGNIEGKEYKIGKILEVYENIQY